MYVEVKKQDDLWKYMGMSTKDFLEMCFGFGLGSMLIAIALLYTAPSALWDNAPKIAGAFFVLFCGITTLRDWYIYHHKAFFFVARGNPDNLENPETFWYCAVTDMSCNEMKAMIDAESAFSNDIILLIGTKKRRDSWVIYPRSMKEGRELKLSAMKQISVRISPHMGTFPSLEAYWGVYRIGVELNDVLRHSVYFEDQEGDRSSSFFLASLFSDASRARCLQKEVQILQQIEAAWRARIRMLVQMSMQSLDIMADTSVTKKSEQIQQVRVAMAEMLLDLLSDQPDISFLDILERLSKTELPETPQGVKPQYSPLYTLPHQRAKWFPKLPKGVKMPKLGFRTQVEATASTTLEFCEGPIIASAESNDRNVSNS